MVGKKDEHLVHDDFDTPEEVERIFRAQRKLSFTYGFIFFLVTLAIPTLSLFSDAWYGKPIFGGMTLNYFVLAFIYHIFYIVIGLAYTLQANKLEDELLGRRVEGRVAENKKMAVKAI
ncbi:hypothetical protein HM1_2664 [Heliomicrobium modesticaldum Ice1]|uniref:DUF485 domain-containing protein n=1 Tax=Heliobacterium modesticaldum (strain ATCC 51547 / Ice1) TaxID=498761 RepID=B0TBI0_HELMI|nr:DUF485 domain-containing protein [Heliomicrobium modesticaldum]ABZ85193.1 hypothetical protein HM1_2664 [Heliomicrobium modesticaldum Ice1]